MGADSSEAGILAGENLERSQILFSNSCIILLLDDLALSLCGLVNRLSNTLVRLGGFARYVHGLLTHRITS